MIEHLLTIPATIVKRVPGPADPDTGEPTATSTPIASVLCEIQPQSSVEPAAHGGAVIADGFVVFLPAGTELSGWDALELADGRLLELDGEPFRRRSPLTGVESHVEARLVGAR